MDERISKRKGGQNRETIKGDLDFEAGLIHKVVFEGHLTSALIGQLAFMVFRLLRDAPAFSRSDIRLINPIQMSVSHI